MNCSRLLRQTERHYFSVFKIPSRYASQHPIRFLETQKMWQEKDGVPKRWQLIYKAPMSTALNFMSPYLTFTTGVISVGAIYYAAFVYDGTDLNKPIIIGDDVVIANSPIEGLAYLGAFIALHVALNMLLSKYVIRIYQDGDEYLAIYRGYWFNLIRKHKFHLNDFRKLNPIMVVPWSESRYSVGSKKAIILENYFKTPEHLNYLLTKKKIEDAEED